MYCKRHEIEWKMNMEVGYLYVVFLVLNFLLTHVFLEIVEMATTILIHLEMSKYTLVALVSCILLVFLIEGVEKYLQVKVSVSVRNTKRGNRGR